MRLVSILACLFLSAVSPSAAAAGPHQVTDFYALLAAGQKVTASVEQTDGHWSYAKTIDGEENGAKGEPLVDQKNGYMRFDAGPGNATEHVELVLFTAKGGRKLIGVAHSGYAGDAELAGVQFFEFTGSSFRDVSKEMGALSTLKPADFLDEAYLKTKQAKADKPGEQPGVLLLEFALPRQGTTVVATVKVADTPPPIEEGEQQLADAKKLLAAHGKYKSIELAWSKDSGKFSIAAKK